MPNTLTFESPLDVAPFASARIAEAERVNDTTKTITFAVELTGADDLRYWRYIPITVTNGVCRRLVVQAAPANLLELFTTEEVTAIELAALATAYDTVMGAYFQALMSGGDGNGAVLGALVQLGLLPAGTVS